MEKPFSPSVGQVVVETPIFYRQRNRGSSLQAPIAMPAVCQDYSSNILI